MASSISPRDDSFKNVQNADTDHSVSSSTSRSSPQSAPSAGALRDLRKELNKTSTTQTLLGAFGLGLLGNWTYHVISRVTIRGENSGGGGATKPNDRNATIRSDVPLEGSNAALLLNAEAKGVPSSTPSAPPIQSDPHFISLVNNPTDLKMPLNRDLYNGGVEYKIIATDHVAQRVLPPNNNANLNKELK